MEFAIQGFRNFHCNFSTAAILAFGDIFPLERLIGAEHFDFLGSVQPHIVQLDLFFGPALVDCVQVPAILALRKAELLALVGD